MNESVKIDLDKLMSWIGIQLDDLNAIYEAMGNDKAYGAIKAYEAIRAQIRLMTEVCNE